MISAARFIKLSSLLLIIDFTKSEISNLYFLKSRSINFAHGRIKLWGYWHIQLSELERHCLYYSVSCFLLFYCLTLFFQICILLILILKINQTRWKWHTLYHWIRNPHLLNFGSFLVKKIPWMVLFRLDLILECQYGSLCGKEFQLHLSCR